MLSTAEILTTTALSILVLSSLVGNSLVVMVVVRNRTMRKPVNLLITNLAVCDGLFTVFLIPRFLLIYTFEHPVGKVGDSMCNSITGGSLSWTSGVASVYTLVAIAWERYYAVVHPLQARVRFDMANAKRAAAIAWVASIALNSPLFFVYTFNVDLKFCTETWENQDASKAYAIIWPIMAGPIPLSFMLFLYIRVIVVLWGKNKGEVTQQALLRSRKKITKIAILVTAVYFLTWFPSLIHNAFVAFAGDWFVPGSEVYRIFRVLTTLNAAGNPFIYSLHSRDFRKNVRDLVCCKRSRQVGVQNPASNRTLLLF